MSPGRPVITESIFTIPTEHNDYCHYVISGILAQSYGISTPIPISIFLIQEQHVLKISPLKHMFRDKRRY